ncbi:MAG: hypothetical protein ABSH26_13980 [Opitutaceae bacterium]|jgi:hypothetical protein
MTLDEFRKSTSGQQPPSLSGALLALWQDARGDWAAAHGSAQEDGTANGAWVHAYLHRREGDLGNAGYWYRRAGRPPPKCSLDAEWEQIAGELLEGGEA